jgi:hypothetical protein
MPTVPRRRDTVKAALTIPANRGAKVTLICRPNLPT